ncbi:cytochrome C oxidase subunit II [Alsobacter sp. SYSU M60028]|uniref:Cytochrome C oxidase subunit II n=1 Tax=Alsobacter ponti TaxID=2962936 RepID=A0ABT1L6T6_9HYPH|nr:cytochrome C oxidase subunit II [Alsobacter ponti]MCP8937129.1 cytochrome C oxidase subunit II [Alsobacter ponti]
MTVEDHDIDAARVAERVERRWATLSIAIIVVLAGAAAFAGIHKATMPQARVETVEPQTIHLSGEFTEANLGSAAEPDGSVTVRAVGQQYSFTPQCMVVPVDTPVLFRATSPDVVHGFLIQGTNVNTMLVPGYVSQIPARFSRTGDHLMPCQEFCGVGHEGMWAKVKVVTRDEFLRMSAGNRRVACVD